MTTLQLADNIFPVMKLKDSVETTLQLMNDHKTSHLPVAADDRFLGLISEDDLEDEANKDTTLDAYQDSFNTAAINERFHFLKAASVFNLYHSNVIPVVNDSNELTGTISAKALLAEMANFCGASEYGAMVVLDIERSRFAISEINSIIESDGATIMHLNVSPHPVPGLIQVTIQINKKEIATIIATFERYDYAVSYYSGEELFENELNVNYNNLMNYLNV
ncbi:CBS domain-containing protein [Hanamia caeni]|jgi:CBS domain-containing protein|uniref:CBS domain-containing protein n=1 Tax=Hanamia caeni TaxID=2294116 RepID=A0A3M9NJA5_9BACT|nr:CBS domain-containing protein [Hanamia caeni]RNI37870.1 CBS domain-containing protein [Hanamia caeni]